VVLTARSVHELAGADLLRKLKHEPPLPMEEESSLSATEEEFEIYSLQTKTQKDVADSTSEPTGSYDVDGHPYRCYIDHPSTSVDESTASTAFGSPLCENCQNVFDHWEDIRENGRSAFRHCENMAALVDRLTRDALFASNS
jgi:hypothetical protein